MTTSAAPDAAATSASSGSASPLTSLMIAAPASTAARATSGFHVSTETVTPAATSRSTSGTTRPASTSAGVTSVYVTPDSPPTSMRSAPAATSASACSTWRSSVSRRTLSENESGPAFTMPITSGSPALDGDRAAGDRERRQRAHAGDTAGT